MAICFLSLRYFRFMILVAVPMAIRKENRMAAVGRVPKWRSAHPMTGVSRIAAAQARKRVHERERQLLLFAVSWRMTASDSSQWQLRAPKRPPTLGTGHSAPTYPVTEPELRTLAAVRR